MGGAYELPSVYLLMSLITVQGAGSSVDSGSLPTWQARDLRAVLVLEHDAVYPLRSPQGTYMVHPAFLPHFQKSTNKEIFISVTELEAEAGTWGY